MVAAGEMVAVPTLGDFVVQTKTVAAAMRCSKCGDLIQAGQRAALVELTPGRPLGWMCDDHRSETRDAKESK